MPKINTPPSDIPPYKKRSKGTGTKKATHKHTYVDGILLLNDNRRAPDGQYVCRGKKKVLCEYCTICGKIGKTYDWLEVLMSHLREEELQRKLNDTTLRVFECDAEYAYTLKKVDLGE